MIVLDQFSSDTHAEQLPNFQLTAAFIFHTSLAEAVLLIKYN